MPDVNLNPADAGNGSGSDDLTGGASDGAVTPEQFNAMKLQSDTLSSKLSELNSQLTDKDELLTKTVNEMKKARSDAALARKKKAAANSEGSNEEHKKHLDSVNREWEERFNPLKEANERLMNEIKKDKIQNQLVNLCLQHGAKQPKLLANYLANRVRLDETTLKVEVIGEDGQKDFDGLNEMTIEKLVSNFLTKPENSNLVKSDGKTGSGGMQSNPGGHSFTQAQIAQMSPSEYAKHRSVIQKF